MGLLLKPSQLNFHSLTLFWVEAEILKNHISKLGQMKPNCMAWYQRYLEVLRKYRYIFSLAGKSLALILVVQGLYSRMTVFLTWGFELSSIVQMTRPWNYKLQGLQDLKLFFLVQPQSLNKLLAAFRWMSFTGTHTEWFTRVQTTASLKGEKNNDIKRFPVQSLTPSTATQVVKRTYVLHKLTRTSLSEGRMSGMCPCGQWACESVIKLVYSQSLAIKTSWSTTHLCGVLLGPGLRNFYLRSSDFDPQVSQLGTTLVQTYQLSHSLTGSYFGL